MINISYCLFAFIAIISALLLIIRRGLNTILILAQLLIVFIMASFQFLILDFYYLGLTYIIVYVGAIAILFLFVIMLIQTQTPIIIPQTNLIRPSITKVS
jgi:NADH:ubiquinone oxidoreductase subunit 6 (subunit J)